MDEHKHKYPVEVQLLSNADQPPILDFVCGICKQQMKYYMYFDLNSNLETIKQHFNLRCPNGHTSIIELNVGAKD